MVLWAMRTSVSETETETAAGYDAVITVRANFTDAQQRATGECGRIARFSIVSVLSEPTAAANYFAARNGAARKKLRVLIFDFGGSTLDVSLIEVDSASFVVLATVGEEQCGEADIDETILRLKEAL
jgi:molecular chaperone DnaK